MEKTLKTELNIIKNYMVNKLLILFCLFCLTGCAVTEVIRYDSNSDRYKKQHGIQRQPAKTQSGPRAGCFYKR